MTRRGSEGPKDIDSANRQVMADPTTVQHYVEADYLDPGEKLLYDAVAPEAKDQPLLDIGVGGGRTVQALTGISKRYVAVDYTPAMVEATRRRYPGIDVRPADARSLTAFGPDSFQLAVFSCAGIDMVDPSDRAAILREVLRVLRPGGSFVFSTHSWEHRRTEDDRPARPAPSFRHPLRSLRAAVRYWREERHRRARAALDQRHADWALLNSRYHQYRTLMYYVTLGEQLRQLRQAGYASARAATHEGAWIESDAATTYMFHLWARKAA
jgi:SAM-dependent methyltransferase